MNENDKEESEFFYYDYKWLSLLWSVCTPHTIRAVIMDCEGRKGFVPLHWVTFVRIEAIIIIVREKLTVSVGKKT